MGALTPLKIVKAKHHRRHRCHRIGFEQVRRHAGAIADVVAHIVRDDRWIAGIVLRNSGFDFTHEVRADVRRLGIDSATHTRKHRNQTPAETKAEQAHGSPFPAPRTGRPAYRSR